MSRGGPKPLPLGRVLGFRGAGGEITVRIESGEAVRWESLRRVVLEDGGSGGGEIREVEHARAYGDRLVLKLAGVDDARSAASLKGKRAMAPADEVPDLPAGTYWAARLVGFEVAEERGDVLGEVEDVVTTGGTDLLTVRGPSRDEILVPFAREFVLEVNERARRIVVRLPEGLRELNAGGSGA